MDNEKILALMYDYYNLHVLRDQNKDIDYYISQINKYDAKQVLVVGAGTGRVAIPLSKYANVTALDFDRARLEVLKEKEVDVDTICINFLDYRTDKIFDLIIVPYSTLQFDNDVDKLNLFFKSLYNIMKANTIVIFDVSESFNIKPERMKEFLFKDYFDKINDEVEVYYSSKRYDKYIEFFIEYKLCNHKQSLIENERYYYYDKQSLFNLINSNSLELLKVDDGYGNDDLKHKHLYHCRRRK